MFLLDSSVILACLDNEDGARKALSLIEEGAIISTVNYTEVIHKLRQRRISPTRVGSFFVKTNIEQISYTPKQASESLKLPIGRDIQLSLADRACLATAISLGCSVLTADRAWAELKLPIKVELIR